MPGLTSACGKTLAESAAVCLEDCKHQAGVSLQLAGLSHEVRLLQWPAVDDQQRRCYNDLDEATEWGACGIAILVIRELTGMSVVQRSKKGLGFDYWLGENDNDNDDDQLFSGIARLEVSGIRFEASTNEIATRVKQKKAQIKPSNHLAPGYVAVVEFGKPTAHVEVGP